MSTPHHPEHPNQPEHPRPGGRASVDYQPDWDLTVLDHPVVLDIPDTLLTGHPENEDPLLRACIQALTLTHERHPHAHVRIGDLGRAGVVALRTGAGNLELHETLLGWVLAHAWGDPDQHDLATAARLRAHRLARERRSDCGAPAPHPNHRPNPTDDHTHGDGHDDRDDRP